jgi:hypothetical protein
MATYDSSLADLVKSAIRDAQDLIVAEIALAKSEARAEVNRIARGAILLGAAAFAAIIGVVFLLTTLARALSDLLVWPVWAGFGIVTLVTLLVALVLAIVGRGRMRAERRMPQTVDTMKENMKWMRARTS